ncbi:hypothetical protein ACQY0O_004570 [Thecaphora frezii]
MSASSSAAAAAAAAGSSVFLPARFEKLHRRITEAVHDPARLSRSNEWYIAIDRNRAELADLGRVRPQSDAERKEIESGTITIDGVAQSLNADFSQQTLLLAKELAVSERYAASLLQAGIAGRARWGRGASEVACILFHREKLALLACIKDLFRNALTLPFEPEVETQQLGTKMEQLVESLVAMEVPVGTAANRKKVTLPERILAEIDLVKESIRRVQASLRAANNGSSTGGAGGFLGIGSSTGNASSVQGARLGDEIQLERLAWLQQERRELGHMLYLLAISSLLSTSNIAALIRWLAAAKPEQPDEMHIYVLTALLGAIDTNPDARGPMVDRAARGTIRRTVESLMDDESFITSTHIEITKKRWAIGELNSVVALQWSVFLVEAFSRNPSFRVHMSIGEEQIQDLVLRSVAGAALARDPAAAAAAAEGPKGDAFVYLIVRVLAFRQKALDSLDGAEEEAGDTDVVQAAVDGGGVDEEVDAEFREYVIQQVYNLVLGVTTVMLPLLRKLQRSEEDAAFAISRGSAGRGSSAAVPQERRYDVEALFDIIALLCRGRPESGLPFWIGSEKRTTRFLSWAVDVREPGHQRALLNMLAALSSGTQSASQAYALLDQESAGGGSDGRLVSWARLFEWIKYYVDTFRQAQSQAAGKPITSVGMPPDEAVLLQGFFRLFRNVVYYSSAARDSLHQNTAYAALDRLFALYTCPIPIDLKASILDAMAAFAHNSVSSGSKFSSIATDLWSRLDASQVIQGVEASSGKAAVAGAGGAAAALPFGRPAAAVAGGVLYELEHEEMPNRRFPGTTSFVNFLKALIQIPPQPRDVAGLLTVQPLTTSANPFSSLVGLPGTQSSFADVNQQQAQQQPRGRTVEPYVAFVVDHVFLKARSREYAHPSDQWRILSSCLDFIERALNSYDLSSLLAVDDATGAEAVSDPAVLARLVAHPGFSIMKRLLADERLISEVLNVLVPGGGIAGFEAINQNKARTLFYPTAVKHALRIVQRVLRIQNLFLQVLIPTLSQAPSLGLNLPFDVAAKLGNPGAYTSLDTHLLHAHQSVVQIALYVNCTRDDIALLSVRLLSLIAKSPAFTAVDRFGEMGYRRKMNRLVGLLEMSDEADRLRAGFVGRLEAEPSLDADASDSSVQALLVLAGEDDESEGQNSSEVDGLVAPATDAVEAIRIAILNLLLACTSPNQAAPNVAHLLLGYDLRAAKPEEQVIADRDSPDSPPSALHAILDLLRPEEVAQASGYLSLAERSPGLAEKCYALILRLCTHPFTSSTTLRYLRVREDFFVQQLRSMSLLPAQKMSAETSASSLGLVRYPDGETVLTTVDSLVASLRLRGHLLELAALELHTLISANMHSRAAKLVAALFGAGVTVGGASELDDQDDEDIGFIPQRDFDGGLDMQTFGGIRFLEMLRSLDFLWNDERDAIGQNITIVRPEQLDAARRPDADVGPRVYDLKAILSILFKEKAALQQQGSLRDAGQGDPFMQQSAYVLHWASAQNAKRAIAHARRRSLQAWRHTLDMVLARATNLLRVDARAALLLDCLAALLPRLAAPTQEAESDPALADLVAGAVLSLLTSLRQHRVEMTAGAYELEAADVLPIDRLISTLRALIDSILRLGTTTLARGNLYSALINYLQLLQVAPKDLSSGDGFSDAASVAATDFDDSVSIGGLSSIAGGVGNGGRSSGSMLETRTKSLLLANAERLVDTIARDALDAADVWKTVAFTLLDKLCALDPPAGSTSSRKGASKALELLRRRGYLKSFITSLQDSDIALQDTLRPDPESLNALYVYESRLAFYNRIAQTREGAESLLDARIFDVLAQADFLAARPEQDQDFVDLDSFLPAATERYNALVTPALQLSVSILASTAAGLGSNAFQGVFGSGKAIAPSSAHAAPRQALGLLTAHREAFLAILKAPLQEFVSVAQLEQAQLVVSLFLFAMPTLDDDALQPPNTLAPFHSAILALAAPYLQSSCWKARVVPFNDAEREEARTPASYGRAARWTGEGGGGGAAGEDETVFDARAATVVGRAQRTLLAYFEAASDSRGNEKRTRPVLNPSMVVQRDRSKTPLLDESVGAASAAVRDDYEAGYGRQHRTSAAAVPSLGTAVAALDEYVTAVAKDLKALENTVGLLENADGVRMDEWDEVVRDALKVADVPTDMGPAQRRSIAMRELRNRKAALRASSTAKLDAIEMLLVLLVRHVDLFLSLASQNGGHGSGSGAPLSASLLGASTASGFLRSSLGIRNRGETPTTAAGSDRNALAKEAASVIVPILEEKIGYLTLPTNVVPNAKERLAFLQMAGRRLASVLLDE